ncbi:MAG: VOC family protein [Alphaproteobacteria bacterium]|nr:VOC family protein [Alphaproteobacteria bacterium]
MTNAFFWYDVMTSDVEAAGRFYCDAVGWQIESQGPDYNAFTVNGPNSQRIATAGLMAVPEDAKRMGARPAWMGYIQVPDVATACEGIREAGGKIFKGPITIDNIITFAVAADPQGAGFLIAKPLPQIPPARPAPGTPGTIGWHELYATDWQAVWHFYERQFGWSKSTAMDMGAMGTYQILRMGGDDAGAMMTKPKENPAPQPYWSFYINVASVTAAAEKIKAGGGTVLMGPHEVPGGQHILQALDPQGALFALVSAGK